MKVLITVNAAWNVWNFRRSLIVSLIEDGHEVTVYAPHDDTVPELKALGCKFIPLSMDAKGLNPVSGLILWFKLRQVFKKQKPDVVLSFTIKNNVFGALAARSTSTKFIPNVTGLGTAFLSGGLLQTVAQLLYRLAFRSLPVVFFQNSDDSTLFTNKGMLQTNQVRVLPGSGIDLKQFPAVNMPENNPAPIMLMIARLLRDKGVLEFVEAAQIVKADYPNVRFQLLGAAGSENRTAIDLDTVNKWVLEGVIEYLGTTTDVRPILAAASCIVLPSYREGAPRTLIEAAATGRPVVTTDVPGCRSVVEHGTTGFLCQVRDAESLAQALVCFVRLSGSEQRKMGQAGRQKMETEFADTLVIEAYRNAIQFVTNESSHSEQKATSNARELHRLFDSSKQ